MCTENETQRIAAIPRSLPKRMSSEYKCFNACYLLYMPYRMEDRLPSSTGLSVCYPPFPDAAGAAIHSHLQAIMPPLLQLTCSHPDTSPTVAAAHEAVSHVALSVQVCMATCV